jgi:hypothetical protein
MHTREEQTLEEQTLEDEGKLELAWKGVCQKRTPPGRSSSAMLRIARLPRDERKQMSSGSSSSSAMSHNGWAWAS